MNNIFKKLYSNQLSYQLRNFFKFKPNLYLLPKKKNCSISDFFYWINDSDFETQFILMNIGSHIMPNLHQDDYVNIIIFDYKGVLIKKLNYLLKDLESKKINFSTLNLNGYGSFLVFHSLKNIDYLNNNNTFISERGYVGYRKNKSIWNYMHGNHNAAYIENDHIYSLLPTSFFFNEYIPQTRFDDVNKFKLIFNNLNKKSMPINIELYGLHDNLIINLKKECDYLNTLEVLIDMPKKVKYLKIKSKLLFCRPIIFKDQGDDFDIFHG